MSKEEKSDQGQRVVVTDINMPFVSMVGFIIKWALAAIPAAIIFAVIIFLIATFFGVGGMALMKSGGATLISKGVKSVTGYDECKSSKITVANVAISEEAYFTDHNTYTKNLTDLFGIKSLIERRVKVTITKADKNKFIAVATHPDCDRSVVWDSAKGGLLYPVQ